MVSIFVFGLVGGDAGKTVVSSAIARGLVKRGVDLGVFKAFSEHDLWYDYDVYLMCKSEGRLFCGDIVKLHKAAMLDDLPYEVTNPVDRLELLKISEESVCSKVVIERYTISKSKKVFNILNVNTLLASKTLDPEFIAKLKGYAAKIVGFSSEEQFRRTRDSMTPSAIESCYSFVKEKYDHVIVEGHKDMVCPIPSITFDVTIGVAPGVAVLFDAKSFRTGVNTCVKQGVPSGSIRAVNIEPYLKKNTVIKLPPLPSNKISSYEEIAEEFSLLVDVVAKEVERLES
ncbi:MAG: hypothetical protein QW461_06960 [Candidatus Jordarchaeales archaeon]